VFVLGCPCPVLVRSVSRASYYENQTAGNSWGNQTWPLTFMRAPVEGHPEYEITVPEQRILDDVSGDSERFLQPTIDTLLSVITANKTAGGKARLFQSEQLVAVPDDKGMRIQCLNNATFVSTTNPLITGGGGCGFGTRDCRYGTSAVMDKEFGTDRFFVVVGVKHESLKHSSYSSLMLTSRANYEKGAHTLTMRETDGDGGAQQYLPDDPNTQDLFVFTVARDCPPDDDFCIAYTMDQFASDDVIYWMERAYLQLSTGVAPNINEYIMSFVLTFEGSP
jgi:hypothetical protein